MKSIIDFINEAKTSNELSNLSTAIKKENVDDFKKYIKEYIDGHRKASLKKVDDYLAKTDYLVLLCPRDGYEDSEYYGVYYKSLMAWTQDGKINFYDSKDSYQSGGLYDGLVNHENEIYCCVCKKVPDELISRLEAEIKIAKKSKNY